MIFIFIPSENMFEGKVTEEKRIELRRILRFIISSDFKYIFYFNSGLIPYMFREVIFSGVNRSRRLLFVQSNIFRMF